MKVGQRRPLRVASFSGALGDHFGALAEAVHREPVDVLIGDYLAEMTMARIAAGFAASPSATGLRQYFVSVFLHQIVPELEAIADRGLKIVVNAGAFNPAGLAARLRSEIAARELALKVAVVDGDDVFDDAAALVAQGELAHLDTGEPAGRVLDRMVAANAYLGAWGIVAALDAGADIVICGRVTDASLVLGPAVWWHGWARTDWDRLAGGIVAGHVIECGPQAQGGNFAGFAELGVQGRLGFPIAEIAADGSSIITKRAGEGGRVTVDTVTAQLLYEVQGARYLNPDVVVHLDSVKLRQVGEDRVEMACVRGSPPPTTTKVGCFYTNGFGTILFGYATGLEVDAKVAWLREQMRSVADSLALDAYHFDPLGQPVADPATQAQATIAIRIAASAQSRGDIAKLIQGYSSFGLGGIPGFHGDGTGAPSARVDYWPGLLSQQRVPHRMTLDDGPPVAIDPPPVAEPLAGEAPVIPSVRTLSGPTQSIEFGRLILARSGDKGGNANLGIWARDARIWPWLEAFLSTERLRDLLGLPGTVAVERTLLANVHGLVFVLRDYFGVSGSGNVGLDQIGKALGEFLRARMVDAPAELVP